MNNYIFINSKKNSISNYMFQDLKRKSNVVFFEEINSIENKIIKFFEKICLSYKINRFITVPFKDWFNTRFSVLNKVSFLKDQDYYILMTNDALNHIDVDYMNELQQKNNLKFVLILLDPIDSNTFALKYSRNKMKQINFEKIITFQKEDAIKYGYIFCMDIYSKLLIDDEKIEDMLISAELIRIDGILF